MLKRLIVFLYGSFSYVVFLATFLTPSDSSGMSSCGRSIDAPRDGVCCDAVWRLILRYCWALPFNTASWRVPAFKRWMTRFIPEPAERSTYVLASSLALITLFVFWSPLGGTVWSITSR